MLSILHSKIAATSETTPVEDPLGAGVVFHVRSIADARYQAHLEEVAAKSPVVKLQKTALIRARAKWVGGRRKKGEDARQRQVEMFNEELMKLLEDLDPEAFDTLVQGDPEGVALLVEKVDNWRDEHGEPMEIDPSGIVALLADRTLIAGGPHAGEKLGPLLQGTILVGANEAMEARAALLEEAEGNSGSSRGSDTGSSRAKKDSTATRSSRKSRGSARKKATSAAGSSEQATA